jgi:hypothetical protein
MLLREKFGHARFEHLVKPRTMDEAMSYFNHAIKPSFNPYNEDEEWEHEIPMSGMQDIPTIGLEAGYLQLTRFVAIKVRVSL